MQNNNKKTFLHGPQLYKNQVKYDHWKVGFQVWFLFGGLPCKWHQKYVEKAGFLAGAGTPPPGDPGILQKCWTDREKEGGRESTSPETSEGSDFSAGCRPEQSSPLPFHDMLHTFQVPTCFLERKKCGLWVQVAKDKQSQFKHAFLFRKIGRWLLCFPQ